MYGKPAQRGRIEFIMVDSECPGSAIADEV